jgi:cation:H+ antiporter
MLPEIILFILGLVILVKGADFIVDSAARIAKQFGVSDFVIGLTIVAIGTSLPELAASITAAYYGDTPLAVGNVIGSNIANIGLILGLSGVFAVIKIDREIYSRDGFLMLLAVVLFYLFALNGVISRLEGGIFIWLFLAYILFFLTMKRKFKHEFHFKQYLSEFVGVRKKPYPAGLENTLYAGLDYYAYKEILKGVFYELRKMLTSASETVTEQAGAIRYFIKQFVFLSIGIVGVIFGADLLVKSSLAFPIPPVVVGLIFVSIGTSLPELAVAISAVKKHYENIMIGNVIGSNIANILLVGALSAITRPLIISTNTLLIYFPILFGFTWLFLVFSRNDYRINRIEAVTFLLMYLAFVAYLFLGMRF